MDFYRILINSLYICFGTFSGGTGVTVTFPVTHVRGCYVFVIKNYGNTGNQGMNAESPQCLLGVGNVSLSNFIVYNIWTTTGNTFDISNGRYITIGW